MASEPVVVLEQATVRYPSTTVFENVSLTASGGDVVAVRGANGSGKTTLLRVLANVMSPNSGRRYGTDRCAYVPAALTPPQLTAGRWLSMMPRRNQGDVRAALQELAFDANLKTPCRELSFGNLRKLLLADALASGEALIIIDEVSAGLDDAGLIGLQSLLSAASLSGAALVLADQASRPIPLATRELVMPEAQEQEPLTRAEAFTEITLRGPTDQKDEAVASAADYGFLPVEGDQ